MAIGWPNHVHHEQAYGWFERRSTERWATTPFTEAAFVRLSSTPAAVRYAVVPAEAHDLLQQLCMMPEHVFLPDDVPSVVGQHLSMDRVVTHRQVTDAHLVAIAARHGARLVTLDRGIEAFAGAEYVTTIQRG